MEKITKKYVNRKIYGREYSREEVSDFIVEEVDPKDITCFYFSEQKIIIDDDGTEYTAKEERCSPIYFVGKRLSFEETLEKPEIKNDESALKYTLNVQERHPEASMCKTDFGYYEVMYNADDITVEEYLEKKKKSRNQ